VSRADDLAGRTLPPVVINRAAGLSADGVYRYTLNRWWRDGPTVAWVMLNPSTADEDVDDPTVLRCIKWSLAWGFGGMCIPNLFALRTTDPHGLGAHRDPVGPEWSETFHLQVDTSDTVVAAWGNNVPAGHDLHVHRVKRLMRDRGAVCLGKTLRGEPVHPLARGKHRVPDDVTPTRYWSPS
jgi:hypothetical protein